MGFTRDGQYASLTPLGDEQITPTTATNPTVPSSANVVFITVSDNPVYLTFDSATPSATNGLELAKDNPPLVYAATNNNLAKLEFLDTAGGASTVNVAYFEATG